MTDPTPRCPWADSDPLYRAYHDEEWGVPLRDASALFELLLLEGMQAGLSWLTILRRRQGMHLAFDGFDPHRIAAWDAARVAALLADPRIIRNRAKLAAAIANARSYLALADRGGDLAAVIWETVDGVPRQNHWRELAELPAATEESKHLSRRLGQLGFKFVGPTICYALMQSAGLVNDHLVSCPRHRQIMGLG